MRKSKFNEKKMVAVLREADQHPIATVAKRHGGARRRFMRGGSALAAWPRQAQQAGRVATHIQTRDARGCPCDARGASGPQAMALAAEFAPHCDYRQGAGGKPTSTKCAAASFMRRVWQQGQTPRRLQENATKVSALQASQRCQRSDANAAGVPRSRGGAGARRVRAVSGRRRPARPVSGQRDRSLLARRLGRTHARRWRAV